MIPQPITSPWAQSTDDVLQALGSSPKGLTREEAKQRREKLGSNEVESEHTTPGWRIFLRQFKSPLVLVLIGASMISFFLGEQTETLIILFLVVVGGVLAFYQEYRSERALRLLRNRLTRHASVLRNGKTQRVDARELTLGDIVELQLGSVLPADVRLISVEDLEVDESVITGESMPVAKVTEAIAEDRELPQEQINMGFLGTHVVQGSALGVVVGIGSATEMGRTASLLQVKQEETDFQKGTREFGNFLLRITLGLALFVAIILGLIRGNWSESVIFALALAVGISPELLPVIVTINLSQGALAMSKKFVLVKRLIAIEDLGNADVFCTDKTGTLTVGKLRAREAIDPEGKPSTLPLAYATQCLDLMQNGKATNPIDEAIEDAVHDGTVDLALPNATREDIISFDFTRRRMSCVLSTKEGGDRTMIVKGATAEVVAVCTSRMIKGESKTMTAQDREQILAKADEYNDQGYRLVAVAKRSINHKAQYAPSDEKDLELLGFVLVSDAPKETAREALKELKELGVRITILTGDNERVTRHVAEQLDFKITGILTGDDLEKMSEDELHHAVDGTNVFARITPAHKLRVIQAYKHAGHTVGFMGDGVNDTPALRAADVGISFDDAVDVAKEAASVILLKKKLSVLADGIREGRRTFINTRTYIYATISSNFGNMLSVAGAALLLPFLPLLPVQILLLNLLSDAPMLAISTDNVSDADLAKPKKWDIGQISGFMYFFGLISSLADYATFAVLLWVAHANMAMFRSSWFVESMLTEIVVIYLLRTKNTLHERRPSLALALAGVLTVVAAFVIVQSSLGAAFDLTPLPMWIYLMIILIVTGYAALTLLGKQLYYRMKPDVV